MDDLIDLELEAVDRIIAKIKDDPEPDEVKRVELELWTKIRNAAVNGRRTGLGITSLGDTFAYLGLSYGSDASIELTESIYKVLALNSYRSSVVMAQERGAFPIFSHDVERDHPFIRQVMDADPELAALYAAHGRRNIANTTTAPAGSTSIETQTSSGCEPVLFLKARRKRKLTTTDKMARVDEVDKLGDKWQYYDVYHHGVQKWMDVTGEKDETKSPYHGSTVEEIDWLKKIDIQAAAQKWICHSISNTTNLPKDVSNETVEKLCWRGWETGCKGVTIYRIGSRDAVIVKEMDALGQPLVIVETHAPKRPREVPCDIHRTSVQGEQYLVLVGLLNDRPYEIFAGLQEHVEVPKKVKRGTLVKNGKNKDGVATYNLRIPIGDDDDVTFKDIVNLFDNPVHGAFTRTISLALRHGVPVQYLCEQLRKDKNSNMTSFSNCVARVLSKSYIPDGTKVTIEKKCSNCDSADLVYQQGCVCCMSCGNSKCG
jgi:ribonucleoside-diphosphate reductase alpha chain